jgi:hypothetical protein
MDKRTGAKGQSRAQFNWIAVYQPQQVDPGTWTAVQPFVISCAEKLGLDGGAAALRVVRVLTRLAAWALADGLPLDPEVVLDPDTVERFVAVDVSGSERSRGTYRAELRRVGPLLTRRAPWETRSAPLARRQVAPPYTSKELEGLQADSAAQTTQYRARAARALLALGAGAGLDGRWVARVGARDVITKGHSVLVRVGEPSARTVPVLAHWENEVVDLATTAGDEFLVGGRSTSRNRAGSLAASLVVANGHPKFSASRLRSTWLVSHLAMGTRLPELARAAGLQGVTVLSDLLPFVPLLEDDEGHSILRGAR